jgi:hypothetical protein
MPATRQLLKPTNAAPVYEAAGKVRARSEVARWTSASTGRVMSAKVGAFVEECARILNHLAATVDD